MAKMFTLDFAINRKEFEELTEGWIMVSKQNEKDN